MLELIRSTVLDNRMVENLQNYILTACQQGCDIDLMRRISSTPTYSNFFIICQLSTEKKIVVKVGVKRGAKQNNCRQA